MWIAFGCVVSLIIGATLFWLLVTKRAGEPVESSEPAERSEPAAP
jgi:hypothetical protein